MLPNLEQITSSRDQIASRIWPLFFNGWEQIYDKLKRFFQLPVSRKHRFFPFFPKIYS